MQTYAERTLYEPDAFSDVAGFVEVWWAIKLTSVWISIPGCERQLSSAPLPSAPRR